MKIMKNKSKIITLVLLLLSSVLCTQSATTLTGDTILGSFASGNFTLDPSVDPTVAPSQGLTGESYTGISLKAGGAWYGAFGGNSLTDWSEAFSYSNVNSSWASSRLNLVMGTAGTSTVEALISVILYDSNGGQIGEYSAAIPTSFAAGDYIKLNNVAVPQEPNVGDPTKVLGFMLAYNTDTTLTATFASVIPEPSSISLMGLGLMGLAAMRIRRKS